MPANQLTVPSLMILPLQDDTSRHDAGRSLYGRSKARLPTGPASWPTRQGTSPIMVLMARVDAGCSQRAGPPGQLTARRDQTPGGYRMDAVQFVFGRFRAEWRRNAEL